MAKKKDLQTVPVIIGIVSAILISPVVIIGWIILNIDKNLEHGGSLGFFGEPSVISPDPAVAQFETISMIAAVAVVLATGVGAYILASRLFPPKVKKSGKKQS